MGTALRLMTLSEILVGVALVARFFFPSGVNVSVTFLWTHAAIAIPIRWFVPLILITLAGVRSATALLKLVWAVAHAAIPAAIANRHSTHRQHLCNRLISTTVSKSSQNRGKVLANAAATHTDGMATLDEHRIVESRLFSRGLRPCKDYISLKDFSTVFAASPDIGSRLNR